LCIDNVSNSHIDLGYGILAAESLANLLWRWWSCSLLDSGDLQAAMAETKYILQGTRLLGDTACKWVLLEK